MPEAVEATPPDSVLRRLLGSIWLRVIVTVGLLAAVAANVDWSRMEHRLSHGRPGYFAAAVALVVATLLVGVLRWRILLEATGIHLGLPTLSRIYAMSSFSGTFLPTSVGGDVARALLVVRRGPVLTEVAMSVIVDRIGSLVGVIGIAWLAVAIDPHAATRDALVALAVFSALFAVGGAAALLVISRPRLAARFVPARLRALAARSGGVLRTYVSDVALFASVIGVSLVFQGLVALSIVLLARSVDVDLSYSVAALALAFMTLTSLVPISIAGFGVREASYVVVLGSAGISASDATLISLLTVAALFLASLPGAGFLMQRGMKPALESS